MTNENTTVRNIADHVEMDIETLGIRSGSVVASIGVVRFNPRIGKVQSANELREDSLKVVIDISDAIRMGLRVDGDTIKWWFNQSSQAQKSTFASGQEKNLAEALVLLSGFFRKGDKIWGNGANFDPVLVEECYRAVGHKIPWAFWDVRCHRTLKKMHSYDKSLVPKNELAHDCVADAVYQAQEAQAIAFCNPSLIWE